MSNYQYDLLANLCENLSISVTNAHAATYADVSQDAFYVSKLVRKDIKMAYELITLSRDVSIVLRDSERAARFGAEALRELPDLKRLLLLVK